MSVAVHELAGEPGQPLLLVAHATGFHARAYLPMARHLAPPFHVLGVDFRGHGETPAPPGWEVDWRGYGDDALAVVDAVVARAAPSPAASVLDAGPRRSEAKPRFGKAGAPAPSPAASVFGAGPRRSEAKPRFGTAGAPAPSPAASVLGAGSRRSEAKPRFGTAGAPAPPPAASVVGFGHSMGGAALLMAASRRPQRFRLLVLYEPIAFAPDVDRPDGPSPLIVGARRRRATFPSIEAAIANYSSKPPLGAFDPEALDAYVRYGFAANGDGVRLKCDPEHEARTFEEGAHNGVWDLLPHIETPTVVVAGHVEEHQASSGAEPAAARLPNGRFVLLPELDHFGPFTDPARVADLVRAAASKT